MSDALFDRVINSKFNSSNLAIRLSNYYKEFLQSQVISTFNTRILHGEGDDLAHEEFNNWCKDVGLDITKSVFYLQFFWKTKQPIGLIAINEEDLGKTTHELFLEIKTLIDERTEIWKKQ